MLISMKRNNTKFALGIIFSLIITVLLFSGCSEPSVVAKKKKDDILHRQYVVMGGIILEIKFYNNGKLEQKAAKAAYEEVAAVDKICNIYNPESEISRLNTSAFEKAFFCSDLLWDVLKKSRKFYELSNGAFDISAEPLMQLWGFNRKRKILPSKEEIEKAKLLVGLDKVIFNEQDKSIQFTVNGLKLNLGGIAKGYAVDKAVEAATQCGIKSGLINLAGNAYCFPEPPPDKETYVIGVRHPRNKTALCGTVDLLGESVATSGDYERYVVINGQKYAHIMNPATGKPVQKMLAVTVVTPLGINADALSTSIFIKGAKFAEKICKENPKTNVLIIHTDEAGEKTEMLRIGDVWDKCKL
jgi:FAD:protein FMN transferase